jgi:hypothetical protein
MHQHFIFHDDEQNISCSFLEMVPALVIQLDLDEINGRSDRGDSARAILSTLTDLSSALFSPRAPNCVRQQ